MKVALVNKNSEVVAIISVTKDTDLNEIATKSGCSVVKTKNTDKPKIYQTNSSGVFLENAKSIAFDNEQKNRIKKSDDEKEAKKAEMTKKKQEREAARLAELTK